MARRNFNNNEYRARHTARIAKRLRRDAARILAQDRRRENLILALTRKNNAKRIQRAFKSHLWAWPNGPFYKRLHKQVAGNGVFRPLYQEPSEREKQRQAAYYRDPKVKKDLARASLAALRKFK